MMYGTVDPGVISAAITTTGSVASSVAGAVGDIEVAKIRQASEDRAAQAAVETERLATQRAMIVSRRPGFSPRKRGSPLVYAFGGAALVALLVGGVYAYRRWRS